jgi:hypothetical protein
VIRTGQLWKVNGITYRVDALDGQALMNEASRDASVNADLDAQLEALPVAWRANSLVHECYKRRSMQVDLRWFERSDVKQVGEAQP